MISKSKLKQLTVQLFLVLIIVVTAIIQGSAFSAGFPLAGRACILIPLTVCIGMFEKEFVGIILGTLAGMLWDSFSSGTDGLRSLFLALTGFLCGLLVHYFMRNNLFTALVLTAAASVIYTIAAWAAVAACGMNGAFMALLNRFAPSCALSIVVLPLYYFLIRAAEKSFKYSYSENGGIRRE